MACEEQFAEYLIAQSELDFTEGQLAVAEVGVTDAGTRRTQAQQDEADAIAYRDQIAADRDAKSAVRDQAYNAYQNCLAGGGPESAPNPRVLEKILKRLMKSKIKRKKVRRR